MCCTADLWHTRWWKSWILMLLVRGRSETVPQLYSNQTWRRRWSPSQFSLLLKVGGTPAESEPRFHSAGVGGSGGGALHRDLKKKKKHPQTWMWSGWKCFSVLFCFFRQNHSHALQRRWEIRVKWTVQKMWLNRCKRVCFSKCSKKWILFLSFSWDAWFIFLRHADIKINSETTLEIYFSHLLLDTPPAWWGRCHCQPLFDLTASNNCALFLSFIIPLNKKTPHFNKSDWCDDVFLLRSISFLISPALQTPSDDCTVRVPDASNSLTVLICRQDISESIPPTRRGGTS